MAAFDFPFFFSSVHSWLVAGNWLDVRIALSTKMLVGVSIKDLREFGIRGVPQGCGPPSYQRGPPLWEIIPIYISPIARGHLWVSYPQESLENTIYTMGTLLGVHPIVP